MNIGTLLNALPGACAQGLIWGIMAIGVYITYRILDLADLTVDGTMCTGGAVCIMLMQSGHSVGFSLFCAFLAGMAAGLVTGVFHTGMGIPAILAGILTQLGLYSINLRIMIVIVNALRKFESAGVIESRSSGMKGTYIKVINDVVFDELAEIKKERKGTK